MNKEDLLQQIEDGLDEVATIPHVAMKAMELLENQNTSPVDLAKLFEMDMVLSGKLLKLVNSAYYGFSRKITTVTQAVAILGYDNLKNILISTIAFDLFHKNRQSNMDLMSLWLHSLGTAAFSQSVAKEMGIPKYKEYYITGLLHDVGKVVIDQLLNIKYKKVIEMVSKERISLYDAENHLLGINHAEIGHRTALKWKLPEIQGNAIKFHHNLSKIQDNELLQMTSIVQFSDFFCNLQHIGNSGNIKITLVERKTKDIINLSNEVRKKIVEQVQEDIIRAKSFFVKT